MKLAIVYWSGTGNTEAMANAMAEGAKEAGAAVDLLSVDEFGSYGWGSGEWMEDWKKRCGDDGAKVYGDGVIINDVPDEDGLQQCREYASEFVKANS